MSFRDNPRQHAARALVSIVGFAIVGTGIYIDVFVAPIAWIWWFHPIVFFVAIVSAGAAMETLRRRLGISECPSSEGEDEL